MHSTAQADESLLLATEAATWLQRYHEHNAWPESVQLMAASSKLGLAFVTQFNQLKAVRDRSRESLLLEMHKQLSHKYDSCCQAAAIFGYPILQ